MLLEMHPETEKLLNTPWFAQSLWTCHHCAYASFTVCVVKNEAEDKVKQVNIYCNNCGRVAVIH